METSYAKFVEWKFFFFTKRFYQKKKLTRYEANLIKNINMSFKSMS